MSADSSMISSSRDAGSDNLQLNSVDQSDNGQSYITVIPVEYPPRSYHHDFPPGHVARDYLREKVREELRQSLDQLNKDHQQHHHHHHMHHHHQHDSTTNTANVFTNARAPPSFHDESLTGQNYCSRGTSDEGVSARRADVMVFAMSGVAIDLDVDDSTSLTVDEMMNILVDEETLGLSDQAKQAFTLWMCSHYLEVQMKPYHHPLLVRRKWPELIRRFCSISQETALIDDPRVTLKRNCFFPKREEVKIRDQKILELLYEEAKQNILDGRYPCEVSDYEMLAGLQARLELGVYDPQIHTPEFFRSRLPDFLPDHVSRCSWASGVIKTKSSPELRILDQYRRIPLSTSRRKLVRKYLEFSWSLPYYGAAFFKGQIEKPNKNSGGMGFGIASMFRYLFTRRDADVLIAINAEGFYIIDPEKCVVLLGLKYSELSWDFAKPLKDTDPDCLPCLFIQFPVMEAGMPVSKIVQIFSKQAVMMDALISAHVEDIRCRAAVYGDDVDGVFDGATDVDDVLIPLSTVSRKEVPNSCLANKFDKLTMATFNEDGECISKMGSWTFVH